METQLAPYLRRQQGKRVLYPLAKKQIRQAKNRPAEFVVQQGGFACPFGIILLRVQGGHK